MYFPVSFIQDGYDTFESLFKGKGVRLRVRNPMDMLFLMGGIEIIAFHLAGGPAMMLSFSVIPQCNV